MNNGRRELAVKFRVGIFVLAALAAFLGMVYALGARARLFEARYTIHADFTEVGGLTTGATVRLAGVQIGRVTGVHLPGAPGGKVRVDLTIARRYADRVRGDSTARIDTQGLLGDKVIEITVGTVAAPALRDGEVLAGRDPTDFGRMISEGAGTARDFADLVASLRKTTDAVNDSRLVEETSATVRKLGRMVDQAERGGGWAHALLYEEPVALRKLNDTIGSAQALIERVEHGQGAVGALVSPEGGAAARRFVGALDRLARVVEDPAAEGGLLPGLLFDPKYRATLDDLRTAARNLRDVSERVAGGRGPLGSLVVGSTGDGGLEPVIEDLRAAVASLKDISAKIQEGEGTLGALLADPTVYERLVAILEGTERSALLKALIRRLGDTGTEPGHDSPRH